MIRCRLRSLLVLAAAISLSCILAAAIPAELPTNVYQPASPNTNYDPGVIANSAVAESDNCAKLDDLEEQLEHGLSSQDIRRIQEPEKDQQLDVHGKCC